MAELKGVGADAEIVTNAAGGSQSKTLYGFHLIDREALLTLAEVMQYGASRYDRDNWRKIPAEEHMNHMLIHALAHMEGDRQDDHLGHMFCRAMMFFACAKAEERAAQKPTPGIIAVDFDGCLCKNAWPNIGAPNTAVIEELKRRRSAGCRLILWTCRENSALEAAIAWCAEHGLEFDAVNSNLPDQNKLYGNDSRKVGADEYWDDKAVSVIAEGG